MSKGDNVMNVEPAALLMLHSLSKYSDVTLGLIMTLLNTPDEMVAKKSKTRFFFSVDIFQCVFIFVEIYPT
jgi:hypothetical protein